MCQGIEGAVLLLRGAPRSCLPSPRRPYKSPAPSLPHIDPSLGTLPSRPLLPPSHKDPGEHTRPTQVTQARLPITRPFTTSAKFPLPQEVTIHRPWGAGSEQPWGWRPWEGRARTVEGPGRRSPPRGRGWSSAPAPRSGHPSSGLPGRG